MSIKGRRSPLTRATPYALATVLALCVVSIALGDAMGALPMVDTARPAPHVAGEVFGYTLSGSMAQSIVGKGPFGQSIHQPAIPTQVQGRERVAVKSAGSNGLSLHRTGSIVAIFRGKSSSAQNGAGWTVVTPDGAVVDRKGSTLGGLFLLPLGFLADRAVDGGAPLHVGDHWSAKLGIALFGMAARPMLDFSVTGSRQIFGITAFSLTARGTVPVKEPIVTNDDMALGNGVGTAHVTLRCDYDALTRRVLSMDVQVADDLRVQLAPRSGSGRVHDTAHYLVALDADSMRRDAARQIPAPADPPTTAP